MQNGQYHINPIELNGSYILSDLMSIIRENASAYFKRGCLLSDVSNVKKYIQSAIGCEDSEVFGVLFLDNKNRLIEFKILSKGTINSANVHPREVVKQSLKYNASAVIICHNHPSGSTQPSNSDIQITHRLYKALNLIDVNLIDHIIVGIGCTSLAGLNLIIPDSDTYTPSTQGIPLGVESFQVWTKEIFPEEIYEEFHSPKFYTKAEADKFIEHNQESLEGEIYIKSITNYI